MTLDKAFKDVATALCEQDRKTQMTTLHMMANDLQGSFSLNGAAKEGVIYRRAGGVSHVIFCSPVNVTLREIDHCTHVRNVFFISHFTLEYSRLFSYIL